MRGAFDAAPLRAASRPSWLTSASAARWAERALVVLLAVILARITLTLVSPLPLPEGDAVAIAPATETPAQSNEVKSPFPSAGEASADAAAPMEAVADTTLELTLTGVWAAPDGKGSATIQTPDGKQARFAVGDEIVPGAKLEEVYGDRVIINRNGAREALRFETKESGMRSPSAPARPQLRSGNSAGGISRAAVGALATALRAAPMMDKDGNLKIAIYSSRNRQAFSALGFEEGDILVSIDGQPAPTEASELSAYIAQMQRKSTAEMVVERDGEEIPIEFSLEDAGLE